MYILKICDYDFSLKNLHVFLNFYVRLVVHLSLPRQLMMQIQSQESLCLATLTSISVNHPITTLSQNQNKKLHRNNLLPRIAPVAPEKSLGHA